MHPGPLGLPERGGVQQHLLRARSGPRTACSACPGGRQGSPLRSGDEGRPPDRGAPGPHRSPFLRPVGEIRRVVRPVHATSTARRRTCARRGRSLKPRRRFRRGFDTAEVSPLTPAAEALPMPPRLPTALGRPRSRPRMRRPGGRPGRGCCLTESALLSARPAESTRTRWIQSWRWSTRVSVLPRQLPRQVRLVMATTSEPSLTLLMVRKTGPPASPLQTVTSAEVRAAMSMPEVSTVAMLAAGKVQMCCLLGPVPSDCGRSRPRRLRTLSRRRRGHGDGGIPVAGPAGSGWLPAPRLISPAKCPSPAGPSQPPTVRPRP